jgi:putative endonuclease
MYTVYILSSISRVIYVGVTNDLYKRMQQHKAGKDPKAFTTKYRVNRLVYFETCESINDAIEREKQIKCWRREKKVKLIQSANPGWKDLSREPRFSRVSG